MTSPLTPEALANLERLRKESDERCPLCMTIARMLPVVMAALEAVQRDQKRRNENSNSRYTWAEVQTAYNKLERAVDGYRNALRKAKPSPTREDPRLADALANPPGPRHAKLTREAQPAENMSACAKAVPGVTGGEMPDMWPADEVEEAQPAEGGYCRACRSTKRFLRYMSCDDPWHDAVEPKFRVGQRVRGAPQCPGCDNVGTVHNPGCSRAVVACTDGVCGSPVCVRCTPPNGLGMEPRRATLCAHCQRPRHAGAC